MNQSDQQTREGKKCKFPGKEHDEFVPFTDVPVLAQTFQSAHVGHIDL